MKKILSLSLALLLLGTLTLSAFAADWLPGDPTGDGKVTAEDARFALRAAVGLETPAPDSAAALASDATGDGKITAEDARLILRAAVGLEDLAPVTPGPVDPTPVHDGLSDAEAVDRFWAAMKMAVDWLSPSTTAFTVDTSKGHMTDGKTYYQTIGAEYDYVTLTTVALRQHFDPSVYNAYVKEHYKPVGGKLYVHFPAELPLTGETELAIVENTADHVSFLLTVTTPDASVKELTYTLQKNANDAWVFSAPFTPVVARTL